jgi:hypothetical protein
MNWADEDLRWRWLWKREKNWCVCVCVRERERESWFEAIEKIWCTDVWWKNVYIVPLKETKNKMRMSICMTCIGQFYIFGIVWCHNSSMIHVELSPYVVKCDQGKIASNSSSRGNHDRRI